MAEWVIALALGRERLSRGFESWPSPTGFFFSTGLLFPPHFIRKDFLWSIKDKAIHLFEAYNFFSPSFFKKHNFET